MLSLLPLFVVMITLISNNNLLAGIPTSALNTNEDHLALLAIRSRIVNGSEGALSSWNESFHFCQWEGIRCGRRHKRVTKLDLSSRGLSGSLSPFIGNLSFLRVIKFHNNTLGDNIPPEIGRLFRLQQLFLNNNSFEGNVPATLSNCTNLKILWLSYNKLVGTILQEASSLLKLVDLVIHSNSFSGGIPSSIGNLTSLSRISAVNNNLGGIFPNAFGQLRNLELLAFGSNQIHGTIPPSFYNLSLLYAFDIADNQLVGSLSRNIGLKLTQLQIFLIWGNQFTGVLPVSISNCSELEVIDVGDNRFCGKIVIDFGMMSNLRNLALYRNNFGSTEPDEMNFIVSLVNCSNLEDLGIETNQLRGQLPNSVGNLSTQLSILSFGFNSIYGSIPPSLVNLVSLEALSLQSNQFTGIIPTNLGNLRNLQVLFLEFNSLIGNIPVSVGNLSLLNRLHLANNRLDGSIPTTFANCRNLILLDMSLNHLTGNIPKELLGLSSLSISLNLARNLLSGSLPQEIGNLHALMEMDLSENELANEVPSSIGGCISLEYLYLQENYFQGLIPPSFGSLTGLQNLDLSRNNFSGEIPKFFEKFQMNYLNLSFNKFEGELPMNGVFKNATAISVAGNNRLCGGTPELHLPECSHKEGKKGKRILLTIIIVIPIICMMVGLALSLYCLFISKKRRSKTESPGLVLGQPFTKYSYGMLLKGTNEFSSQNMIGAGSFSQVFKGVLQEDGEEVEVAVKVLNLDLRGASKSFMAECEAWRNIRHRNLVKIITVCSSVDFQGNDFKALVYEYMPNGSLESWLHPVTGMQNEENERHRLSFPQRISIATDVAHAIDYLHHQCEIPIIHCDLKPSNILLDKDMIAHVGDFGLAKFLLPNVSRITQGSSIGLRGTIGYAPPEYGLGSEMSATGDVYSFGILLLEMMTGKRPTDSMFQNGLNIHNYARTGLLNSITDIVDTVIMEEDDEDKEHNPINAKQKVECIVSLVKIGIACSVESAQDRMKISQVVQELQRIPYITLT